MNHDRELLEDLTAWGLRRRRQATLECLNPEVRFYKLFDHCVHPIYNQYWYDVYSIPEINVTVGPGRKEILKTGIWVGLPPGVCAYFCAVDLDLFGDVRTETVLLMENEFSELKTWVYNNGSRGFTVEGRTYVGKLILIKAVTTEWPCVPVHKLENLF